MDEACDDPMSLGSVLSALAPRGPLSSPLLGGDRGALLAAHLAASASGIKILQQTGDNIDKDFLFRDSCEVLYVLVIFLVNV